MKVNCYLFNEGKYQQIFNLFIVYYSIEFDKNKFYN